MVLWQKLIWCLVTWLFAASNSYGGVVFFVVAEQDNDPAVSTMTIHPNTQFCARIISPGKSTLNAGFFRFDDPLDCITSPGTHGVNRTGVEDGIDYVASLSPCFNMTLDNTGNGWSDADAMECGAVTSPVDGKERTVWCYFHLLRKTFCAAFVEKTDDEQQPKTLHCGDSLDRTSGYFFDDMMNSTWSDVIYIKGGSCDSGEWENQDIMFEDMTDIDLEMYNEEFSSHLPCSFIHNHNASVDDDRRTKMEFRICLSGRLCDQEYQQRTMVGARLEPLFGVSSIDGSEYLPYRAQRQDDDQVCITYQTVIPNTYNQLACYSFCMNIREETSVFTQGAESLQIRFSDANKNDTTFTKIDVEVVRDDNNGKPIDGTDDLSFRDDDEDENDDEDEDEDDDGDDSDVVGSYPLHSVPVTTRRSLIAFSCACAFCGIMSLLVLCSVPSCRDRLSSSRREGGYAEVIMAERFQI